MRMHAWSLSLKVGTSATPGTASLHQTIEKRSVRGETQGGHLWSQPSLQAPPNAVGVTQAWQVFTELAVTWAGAILFILSS